MTRQVILLCCIGLLLCFSCRKETTIVQPEYRKLVIISDNDPATDIIINIRGAINAVYPEVTTEYIQSKAFDIYDAAYLADIAVKSYPSGTCFAIIVEPGAANRRFICNLNGKKIIAPDNQVISRVLYTANTSTPDAFFIENSSVLGGASWHGLTIDQFYSRAIISMLGSSNAADFGPACIPQTYPIQGAILVGDTIKGSILFTDNFGNCITDIPPVLLSAIQLSDTINAKVSASVFMMVYGSSYSSVPAGQNVCFINGSQRLEMSTNYGNLSQAYNLGAGQQVLLWH